MTAHKKSAMLARAGTPIHRIKLPGPVAAIYKAVEELESRYPGRKFTPDGHLVGSIGEVIAAEEFKLTLHPMSHKGHDAFDASGDVQIKMTARQTVSMYECCMRLIVLRVVSPEEAEVVYDGPGEPAWKSAGKMQRNGQRSIRISKLRMLATRREHTDDIFGFLAGKVTITGDVVSPALTPEEWGDLYFDAELPPGPPRRRR
jgi:hypothetical protein